MPKSKKGSKTAHKGRKQHKPITKAGARRILKEAGAKKISGEAIVELQRKTEEFAEQNAKHAVGLATHAKRKTVFERDIKGVD